MNERFEGLNLPQLLELMHAIVMPEPVSWMPQTEGWWILVGWLIVSLALVVLRYVQVRRKNRYRREALAELDRIDMTAPSAAVEVARIIKRTALAAYDRPEVASLYGAEWAEFLTETAANDALVERSALTIAEAPYKPNVNATDILRPARRWVKIHRA